jgi:uncharacterized membrane protein
MLSDALWLVALTLVPGLELRASIPYGYFYSPFGFEIVVLICMVTNAILGPLVYWLLKVFVDKLRRVDLFDHLYKRAIERTRRKVEKYVDRHGVWGLSLFIGIPLPGSGSYTGALAAYVLGLDFRKFMLANIYGVLIATAAVTIIVVTGNEAFKIFIKVI